MLDLTGAYEAAHEGGVRLDFPPGPRLIRLTGPQRVWFLQNTITADVDDIPSGRWVESCFLDPKGHVIAHFRAGFLDDEVWIDADALSGAELGDWFVKYRFRTKVEIEPVTRRFAMVLGPRAAELASEGAVARTGSDTIAFGRSLAGVAVAHVHGDNANLSLPQGPAALYNVLRIEASVGEFGVDYGPTNLPQEAGLTRVVSVEKGCYVGQETIARIHFRGHVNRVLRTLKFSDVDVTEVEGRPLHLDGATVGKVTSAVTSPSRGSIGLGMVQVEPPTGARLLVDGGGEAVLGPIPQGTKVKQASHGAG
jgi:folate-binding protein YgfZ